MRKAKIFLCMLTLLLMTATTALAQTVVSGLVKDSGGNGLIGAQVRWKNAKSGVITDVSGRFTIGQLDQNQTLVVSYIGYKTQEVQVKNGQRELDITMADDAQNLDELVVIGYGLQKKSSLTGSVETIKAEDLLMMPTTNLDQALTGQVAGLPSTACPVSAPIPLMARCACQTSTQTILRA